MNTFINPQIDLSMLKDKLLYYPFSGYDVEVPVRMFIDYVSEFWFVDTGYFSQGSIPSADMIKFDNIPEFKLLFESFTGPEDAVIKNRLV
jgi:hypothetical protein